MTSRNLPNRLSFVNSSCYEFLAVSQNTCETRAESKQNTCFARVSESYPYKGRDFPYKGRVFPYKNPYKTRIFLVLGVDETCAFLDSQHTFPRL